MGSNRHLILVMTLAGFGCASSAHAGMVACSQDSTRCGLRSESHSSTLELDSLHSVGRLNLLEGVRQYSGGISSGATAPRDSDERVIEIPPPPGSLQLVLSAMLSAGAWQLTRSAKHASFNAPDWYHTGGPYQIGHATPYDLAGATLDLCPFFVPVTLETGRSRDLAVYPPGSASHFLNFLIRSVGMRAPPAATR